jgi:hypothetical protein
MKQTQVLKTFLKSWRTRLASAQAEVSSSGSAESRARVEVLQDVVEGLDTFFADFQVVKRPPRKGRKASKVTVSEDETSVSPATGTSATVR